MSRNESRVFTRQLLANSKGFIVLSCHYLNVCYLPPDGKRQRIELMSTIDFSKGFLLSALAQTPEFAISQRARRKVEALFAELKNYIGLRRLRLRRVRFVREQFYLAAMAQNLKRLVRFLSGKPTPQIATA
jgi:hypothetical protein